MKKAHLICCFYLFAALSCKHDTIIEQTNTTPLATFYTFQMKAIDGTVVDFAQFQHKKVLIVNTATECGFTPQFADLQQLQEQLGDKVSVLGFPANNFAGQEPKDNDEIATFCTQNYGVTFQMFEKIDVIGSNQHPLYQFLTDKNQNGWNEQAPTWNFCKYLIDENGTLTHFFVSNINPLDADILAAINN